MYTKTIEYTDFNGEKRKEDFLFNLTKSELTRMQLGVAGGFDEKLRKIMNKQDGPAIMEFFEDLITLAYGEKSDDGKRFIKSPEMVEAFKQSAAYDVLYMELLTDDKAAADFTNGIIPAEVAEAVAKKQAELAAGENK